MPCARKLITVSLTDHPTIRFNTHTISKPDSSSTLTERDDEVDGVEQHHVSKEICDKIVDQFRRTLGLALFGIDVIVERGTGRHAIIDMNVFPGMCEVCFWKANSNQFLSWFRLRRGSQFHGRLV